jgi:tetrahydromethanopterin S-methyltransferase subunit E
MNAVIVRIVARYLSGALVSYGVIPQEVGADLAMDPDVALVLGAVIGAVTEGVYAFAKKRGWAT